MLNFGIKLAFLSAVGSVLPAIISGRSLLGEGLPEGCEKFTVGKCDPSQVSYF